MSGSLKKHLKQIPYFLLFNYPKKMDIYQKVRLKNKDKKEESDKLKLNCYHSPSPMNELCAFICAWEKKNILWSNDISGLADTKEIVLNHTLELQNSHIMRICRRYINDYAQEIKKHINMQREKSDNEDHKFNMEAVAGEFRKKLRDETGLSEKTIANYVIKVSYGSMSISKALAWSAYGDYIADNLRRNTNIKRNISIKEVPFQTEGTYEYLGKYFEFEEGDTYLQL